MDKIVYWNVNYVNIRIREHATKLESMSHKGKRFTTHDAIIAHRFETLRQRFLTFETKTTERLWRTNIEEMRGDKFLAKAAPNRPRLNKFLAKSGQK